MLTKAPAPVAGTRQTVAIAAVTYFVAMIVALHVVRPELDPVRRPTSEYAVGSYGFLMTTAFLSMSVATWALIMALVRAVSPSRTLRIGLAFMALWAVGVLVAMLFPIDLEGSPQTLSGAIHRTNGPLAFLCVTVGMLLVSLGLRHDASWRPAQRPAVLLSFGMLAMLLATILSRAVGLGIAGLVQRISLAVIVAWFLVVATHARRSSAPGGP